MVPVSEAAKWLLVFILVLLVLLFVMIWGMRWFRRHYLLKEEEEEEEPPYNMTQLQEMYEDGIITGEEFERLKKKIYGRRPYLP